MPRAYFCIAQNAFNSCQVQVLGIPYTYSVSWNENNSYIYFCYGFPALYVRKATFQEREQGNAKVSSSWQVLNNRKKETNRMFLWEEIMLTGNNLQSDWQGKWESVGKGKQDSTYSLKPI